MQKSRPKVQFKNDEIIPEPNIISPNINNIDTKYIPKEKDKQSKDLVTPKKSEVESKEPVQHKFVVLNGIKFKNKLAKKPQILQSKIIKDSIKFDFVSIKNQTCSCGYNPNESSLKRVIHECGHLNCFKCSYNKEKRNFLCSICAQKTGIIIPNQESSLLGTKIYKPDDINMLQRISLFKNPETTNINLDNIQVKGITVKDIRKAKISLSQLFYYTDINNLDSLNCIGLRYKDLLDKKFCVSGHVMKLFKIDYNVIISKGLDYIQLTQGIEERPDRNSWDFVGDMIKSGYNAADLSQLNWKGEQLIYSCRNGYKNLMKVITTEGYSVEENKRILNLTDYFKKINNSNSDKGIKKKKEKKVVPSKINKKQ